MQSFTGKLNFELTPPQAKTNPCCEKLSKGIMVSSVRGAPGVAGMSR